MRGSPGPSYPERLKHRIVAVSEQVRGSTPSMTPLRHSGASRSPLGKVVLSTEPRDLTALVDETRTEAPPTSIAAPCTERSLPFVASTVDELRRSQPCTTAFDRLDHSILRLVQRLPESTLQDKFEAISRWIDEYHVDVVPQRISRQLALMLNLGATEASGTTLWGGEDDNRRTLNAGKAISMAFALRQLLLVLARLKPVMGPIVDVVSRGVYDLIFIRSPEALPRTLFDGPSPLLPKEMECFKGRMHFQDARDNCRKIAALQQFVDQRSTMKEGSRRAMVGAMLRWESRQLSVAFKEWRNVVQQAKEQREWASERGALQLEVRRLKAELGESNSALAIKTQVLEELEGEHRRMTTDLSYKLQQTQNEVLKLDEKTDALVERNIMLEERMKTRDAECAAAVAQWQGHYSRLTDLVREAGQQLWRSAPSLSASIDVLQTSASSDSRRGSILSLPSEVSYTELLHWGRDLINAFHAEVPEDEKDVGRPGLRLTEIQANTTCIECLAVILHRLFPSEMPRAALSEKYFTPSEAEKALNLINWVRSNQIPIPDTVTDDALRGAGALGNSCMLVLYGIVFQACCHPRLLTAWNSPLAPPPPAPKDPAGSAPGDVPEWFVPPERVVTDLTNIEAERHPALRLATSAGNYVASQILLTCFRSQGAAGRMTREEAGDHTMMLFSFAQIGDFVDGYDIEPLNGLLTKHFVWLRQMILHYAGARSTREVNMTLPQFMQMCRDCRIGAPGQIDHKSIEAMYPTSPVDARRCLRLLLELAPTKYPPPAPVTEAFRMLLEQHLKPYASFADAVGLLAETRENRHTNAILLEHRNDLFKVFRGFSDGTSMMAEDQFVQCIDEAKTLSVKPWGAAVGEEATREVYRNVMTRQSTEKSVGFDAFLTGLCALAMIQDPTPWRHSCGKISIFLTEMVLGPFQKKFRLSFSPPV